MACIVALPSIEINRPTSRGAAYTPGLVYVLQWIRKEPWPLSLHMGVPDEAQNVSGADGGLVVSVLPSTPGATREAQGSRT